MRNGGKEKKGLKSGKVSEVELREEDLMKIWGEEPELKTRKLTEVVLRDEEWGKREERIEDRKGEGRRVEV